MVFHYDPKKKFYLVSLQLENKAGALGNLANIMGIRGINILEGYFGGFADRDFGTFSFFIESTNPKLDKEFLKEFLGSAVYVSEVRVKESVEGFLADSLNFPLAWNNGERAILLRMEMAKVLFEALKRAAGPNGNQLVYQVGFEHGKASWEAVFTNFRPRTKEGLGEMLHIFAATGWGRLELGDLDGEGHRARLRMTDGFECTGVSSDKPASHLIRGHLAGAMSAYFGLDVNSVETKCVSKGDKYCEFVFSP